MINKLKNKNLYETEGTARIERAEVREDFIDSNQNINSFELLSFIPEQYLAESIFGVPYEEYAKHDDPELYSDEEHNQLVNCTKVLINTSDDFFIKLVLDTLIFNCQCELGGMRIMMMELVKHLHLENDDHYNGDC